MLYKIKHTTTYKYEESVPLCHNLAILNPRDFEAQNCQSFDLEIVPNPEIKDKNKQYVAIKKIERVFDHKIFAKRTLR